MGITMDNRFHHHALRASFCRVPPVRLFGMLPANHTVGQGLRWLGITVGLLVMMAVPVRGQEQAEIRDPLVDWSHGLRMHRQVEDWIRDGLPDEPGDPLRVSGVCGVQVTLRWSGLVVGRGQATLNPAPIDLAGSAPSSDLMRLTHTATRIALGVVRERLATNLAAEDDAPATLAEKFEKVSGYLTADVQIGHHVERVDLPAGARLDAATDRFAPGYHGLALVFESAAGDEAQAWMWPAEALSRNMGPEIQLVNLVAEINADPARVQQPGEGERTRLYRFAVIHFVRSGRNQPVAQLTRGVELLPAEGLTAATVDAMTERLVDHLARRERLDGTMAGRYEPTSDRYDTLDASPRDQALAAYAMARWLRLTHRPDDIDQRTLDAQAAVRRATDHLARHLLIPLSEPNLSAAALSLMAIVDAPSLADRKTVRTGLRERILAMQADDGSFVIAAQQQIRPWPVVAQSQALVALVKLYAQTRDDDLVGPINRGYGYLAAEQSSWGDLDALPWLAEARQMMRRFDALDTSAADEMVVSLHIRALRALLARQIITPPAGPGDVVGGFDFHAKPSTIYPRPDWHSARALMFIGGALQQAEHLRLEAEGISPIELAYRGALAARFLAQLMFDEPGCFYVRSHEDVLGAVRQSPSDNTIDIPPTAMTLLAVLNFRRAVGLEPAARPLPNE
jgi:hypothetical protein